MNRRVHAAFAHGIGKPESSGFLANMRASHMPSKFETLPAVASAFDANDLRAGIRKNYRRVPRPTR